MKIPEISYTNKHSSSYYIALAAWRRGLSVTFVKNSNNYRVSSKKTTHFFCQSAPIGGQTGLRAHDICKDKHLTKEFLSKSKINVPSGRLFYVSCGERELLDYAEKIGFPVVLKPNNQSKGIGVFSRIEDKKSLINAFSALRNEKDIQEIILEKFFEGYDYRAYVIGENVSAVLKRTPASIVGDGKPY